MRMIQQSIDGNDTAIRALPRAAKNMCEDRNKKVNGQYAEDFFDMISFVGFKVRKDRPYVILLPILLPRSRWDLDAWHDKGFDAQTLRNISGNDIQNEMGDIADRENPYFYPLFSHGSDIFRAF